MKRSVLIAAVAAALVALAIALWLGQRPSGEAPGTAAAVIDGVVQDRSGRRVLYWYDPMAPGQRFQRPGRSPFMDMPLVPKYADEAGAGGVRISPAVEHNLAVRLVTAERMRMGESVSAPGRIETDERRVRELQARVPGFLEWLLVRAEGEPVSAGQKIAEIYSPELLGAQQELLALVRLDGVPEQDALVAAARARLRLLGMAEAELERLLESGRAGTRFGLYAPIGGVVTELAVRQGAQVLPGAPVMRIANLSSVWLVAEVPEREAGRIKAGDRLVAQLESLPGESFEGAVEYVYPMLDPVTRTVRVRAALPNPRAVLRPGMFATVRIEAARREVLAVPSEAVIRTGERSLVIAREQDAFRPVEVRIGAESGGRTEILSGLEAGDLLVASGQFLIDSEASLSGALARLGAGTAPAGAPHAPGSHDAHGTATPESAP